MVRTGTLLDAGMVYFDARLSERYPTLEIRIADVCLHADDAVLIAALARALVETEARQWRQQRPLQRGRAELLRLAAWRASRSGLGDMLLNPVTGCQTGGGCHHVLGHVSDALADAGDTATVAACSPRSSRGATAPPSSGTPTAVPATCPTSSPPPPQPPPANRAAPVSAFAHAWPRRPRQHHRPAQDAAGYQRLWHSCGTPARWPCAPLRRSQRPVRRDETILVAGRWAARREGVRLRGDSCRCRRWWHGPAGWPGSLPVTLRRHASSSRRWNLAGTGIDACRRPSNGPVPDDLGAPRNSKAESGTWSCGWRRKPRVGVPAGTRRADPSRPPYE